MLKTNESNLVEFLLQCQPGQPRTSGNWGVDRQGAISIGVVVHSDCRIAGHGPGVTTLMTCPTALIKPVIDPQANIADLFGIGTQVKVGEG